MPAYLSKLVAACATCAIADAGAHAGKGTCADAEVHCVHVWENGRWEESFKAKSNLCSGECVEVHHHQAGKDGQVMYMKNVADDTHLVHFAVYMTPTCEGGGQMYSMMSDVAQTVAGDGGKFQASTVWTDGTETKTNDEGVTVVLNHCDDTTGVGTCDDMHPLYALNIYDEGGDETTFKGDVDMCSGECAAAMMYTSKGDPMKVSVQHHKGTENTPVHFVLHMGEGCKDAYKIEVTVGLDTVMAMTSDSYGTFVGAKGYQTEADGSDPKEEVYTLLLHYGDHDDGKKDDEHHDEDHVTCGQVREMYKVNECCGQPEKMFKGDGRRLLSDTAGDANIEEIVRQAMKKAHGNGNANGLKSQIMDVLKPYL